VRVGVFGGTFDPPHLGHWLVAQDALEALSLDRLLFVPAAQQPLKGPGGASPAHRLAMVKGMVGNDPRFGVESVEIDRAGLSFTIETLRTLRTQYPEAELHLLLGADAAMLFPKWREPEAILALARLVVLHRDGVEGQGLTAALTQIARTGAGEPISLATRRIDVSSTEIRARLAAGQPIRGFVPDSVADYVAAHGLYRQAPR
jgi:nicotinate-nucleotide adenylyltransferase